MPERALLSDWLETDIFLSVSGAAMMSWESREASRSGVPGTWNVVLGEGDVVISDP